MLNDREKYIYNLHLKVYRRSLNQPFTYRKEFDDFEKEHPDKYIALKKLSSFLSKIENINLELFFESPFFIYNREGEKPVYFNLDYFCKMKAIRDYINYTNLIANSKPDSDIQLTFCRNSLKFIKSFCIDNNIKTSEYLNFKPAVTYSWMQHVKNNNVSFYVILGFDNGTNRLYDTMMNIPKDEQELFLDKYIDNFIFYKNSFQNSSKCKPFVIESLRILNNKQKV